MAEQKKMAEATKKFLDSLSNAEGTSELVIAVFVDLRGFSDFSKREESPNVALFIKRFFLKIISDYFPSAEFVKPTGDGLLLIFKYKDDPEVFKQVAQSVVDSCLEFLGHHPVLFEMDAMINFDIPQSVGFGIARGTACCLKGPHGIVDYSGHLINLAARLTSIARPGGIVLDGRFGLSLLSEEVQGLFASEDVYLKGISDEKPTQVHYLSDYVLITDFYKKPRHLEDWRVLNKEFTAKELEILGDKFTFDLPEDVKDVGQHIVKCTYPNLDLKGYQHIIDYKDVVFGKEGPRMEVTLDLARVKKIAKNPKFAKTTNFNFRIRYLVK